MQQPVLLKNQNAIKKLLFNKLAKAPALKFGDRLFFGFTGLALAVFALVIVGVMSKDNVALAGINPFATPEAKGRNLLSNVAKRAEVLQGEDLPDNEVKERKELARELRAASQAPEVEWIENDSAAFKPSNDEERQNQKFIVDDKVVESIGQAMQLRPKEVKKQVRYKSEEGEVVFLGFGSDGELLFRASSLDSESVDTDSVNGEVKGERTWNLEEVKKENTGTHENELDNYEDDVSEDGQQERRGRRMR